MNAVEPVLAIGSFLLTVLVLSYIFLGDNPLFRFATYAFVGVAAAYVLVVTFEQVIFPRLILPFRNGDALQPQNLLFYLVPLILAILLLFKIFPRFSRVGSPAVAYLVGVGAAVTIGGAVLGTLFPQTLASISLFGRQNLSQGGTFFNGIRLILDALYVLFGTILTLAYFQFSGKPRPNQPPQRHPILEWMAKIGQVFIAVTFGSLFAGVYMAALAALVERISFLINLFTNFTL